MADATLKKKIDDALRAHFLGATIGVFDGYLTYVHAIVVSDAFRNLAEPDRQELLWQVLEQALTPGEVVRVSLALAFTPEESEAKRAFADHAGK